MVKNFTVKDALIKITKSESCTNEILASNSDKIFLYAKNIKKVGKGFSVHLDSKDCLVFLDESNLKSFLEISSKHNCNVVEQENLSFVSEIRNGSKKGFLFSAGAIVNNGNKEYIMIERDDMAPSEKNCWQFPAGRCEEIQIDSCAINELSEEISALDNGKEIDLSKGIIRNNSAYRKVDYLVDDVHISSNLTIPIFDHKFSTLEQFYLFEALETGNLTIKDKEFGRNVDFISRKLFLNPKIKMVESIDNHRKSIINLIDNVYDKELEISPQ
jgi:8-oxo-dGTP pyrophosphatase MutT (NUDIX family)